jgi:4-hydroxy 2-oxovalerate aldolase
VKVEVEIMAKRGDLMTVRKDIRVLDATLRDGGLVNNFNFSDEFVNALYRANVKAGVDYMEFGYKASKELFDVNKFGKWKFCDEADIRAIVGDNNSDMKIAVMADVGRCDYKKDIIPKKDSVIDMIRVAAYVHQMPAAIEMIEDAKAKGYEVTCNIMAISNAKESDIDQALEMVAQSSVDCIYIVDSYGSLYPEQIRDIADKYMEIADKYGKTIGMHAHNNQQLAFANTIEATARGVSLLDATMMSMGRGAGNCAMELLISFLKNPKYNIFPVLKFIEQHMIPLKESGLVWGYDIPYLLTGRLNQHPSSAIDYMKEQREDYTTFYMDLLDK